MADNYTTLNLGSGGDAMDEEAITYGVAPTTRNRARVVLGGSAAAELVSVKNSTPTGTEYGLITRNIPSGTQTVAPANGAFATDEGIILLRRLVKLMESQATVDSANRQKVTIDAIGNSAASAATALAATMPVSSASVTSWVGNASVVFGVSTSGNSGTASNNFDSRYFLMDIARDAYANGIRSKLSWS